MLTECTNKVTQHRKNEASAGPLISPPNVLAQENLTLRQEILRLQQVVQQFTGTVRLEGANNTVSASVLLPKG